MRARKVRLSSEGWNPAPPRAADVPVCPEVKTEALTYSLRHKLPDLKVQLAKPAGSDLDNP